MRLVQHINEMDKRLLYGDMNELISKNCKQYLNLIKGKMPLYRGMKSRHDYGVKDVRKDRKPFGMTDDQANILNKMLEKDGHARRDQSVLCSPDIDHVEMFGDDICYMFPLDKIKKYTWMEAKDMNMDDDGWSQDVMSLIEYEATKHLYDYEDEDDMIRRYVKVNAWAARKILKKPVEEHFHTNTGFNTAYNKGWEFWFDCKQYYYVKVNHTNGWNHKTQRFIGE